MDRTSSGYLMLIAGVALGLGGGYVFMHAGTGGVNPTTVGSFAALLAGIVLAFMGKSRAAAGAQEGLAGEVGLEVKGALGLAGSERVEMEGDFGGFKVRVSRRETTSRGVGGYSRNTFEAYVFTVELPNPAGLSFYVGPDSILQAPLGFLPEKLDSSAWTWAGLLAVRGEPRPAAEALFGNNAAWPLFTEFFGRVTCQLKNEKMEFEPESGPEGSLTPEKIKGLINQAVELARLVSALPPAGNYQA